MNLPTFSFELQEAFNFAWQYLINNHTDKSIRHVNESVFRYFVIRHFLEHHPNIGIDDEWKRIDLLLRHDNHQAAIEFKFYDSRPSKPIHGLTTYKGGAGKKNHAEFENSLKSLLSLDEKDWYKTQKANITERYFILVGTKLPNSDNKRDFAIFYYPANEISVDFCELNTIEQHNTMLGETQVFGWLCRVTAK